MWLLKRLKLRVGEAGEDYERIMSSSLSLARSLNPVLLPLVEECQRSDKIKGTIAVTGVKSR